jgi:uncharacterized membrane protein/uncharacterized membrane protein YeaQ/YmgE (transglycosylase-associated protein family)
VQQLLTWTATGLSAGWLARTLLRSRRNFGLAGDMVSGWLGAIVGGWLLRRLGVLAPDNALGHVLVALAGAAALLVAVRVLYGFVDAAAGGRSNGAAGALALEDRIRHLGQLERTILSNLLKREHWARDTNQRFDAQSSFGERVADRVASFGGSWTFIGIFGIVMVSWMALNEEIGRPFDPYPFILLNLVLSCLAALQAPIIMMSQNRQSAKDRLDAKNDYEVNLRAEMEIAAVHAKLDLLREQEWLRLMETLDEQKRTLAAMQARLDELTASRQ